MRSASPTSWSDLLFAVVNVARLLKVHPEEALRRTSDKFAERFKFIEARADEMGTTLEDMTLSEMDEAWNEAKCSGPEWGCIRAWHVEQRGRAYTSLEAAH